MSQLSVPVNDARALLNEETGEFVLEARLANGQEVRFASKPDPETLAELREAMTNQTPEPVKPKRRRTTKTKEATPQ